MLNMEKMFFLDFRSTHQDKVNKKLIQVEYKYQLYMVRNRVCCHGVWDTYGYHSMKNLRGIKNNLLVHT